MRPTLYFELGSPYAYLAVARAGDRFELEPVLLGALFALRGHGSWAQTDARAERMAEVEARAARYGLPSVVWPAGWPVNGLAAMRAATWAKAQGAVEPFARAVYAREFGAGADISDRRLLEECLRDAGVDPDVPPEMKLVLRDATQAAWDAGVRGVPTARAGDALFYGDDHLDGSV